jgi:hypothetical protein
MNQAYGKTNPSRNHFQEAKSFTQRIVDSIASSSAFQQWKQSETAPKSKQQRGLLRRLFSLVNVIILIWIFTLYWGERTLFSRSIDACDWRHWESWVRSSLSMHIASQSD